MDVLTSQKWQGPCPVMSPQKAALTLLLLILVLRPAACLLAPAYQRERNVFAVQPPLESSSQRVRAMTQSSCQDDIPLSSPTSRIALGGGCHWCTEGVFVSLCGVDCVEQGWVSSRSPCEEFSEAVIVHFDPRIISPKDLLAVHLETHASTKNHTMRKKYRSAVYFFEKDEAEPLKQILNELAKDCAEPILTQVLPFVAFRPSLPEHQDYYRTDPSRPFCERFITPKLDMLRKTRPYLLSN